MKHIKSYSLMIEDVHTSAQKGDYVICFPPNIISGDEYEKEITYFINSNIGKCIYYTQRLNAYKIHYDNVPEILIDYFSYDNCRYFAPEQIKFFSPNKEELLPYIQANKYNI